MKKLGLILLAIVLISGIALAYSFSDFLGDITYAFSKFFSLTGFAVLNAVKDAGVSEVSGISIPEPPTVEATDEVVEGVAPEGTSGVQQGQNEQPAQDEIPSTSGGGENEINVPSCSDFIDNNVNYFKKGLCKDSDDRYEDRCSADGTSVLEYSCGVNNFCSGSWYICPNGCKDGVCLSEKEVTLMPDLKILSVSNFNGKLIISVKNLGTKGTFFKTKFLKGTQEIISGVNYYLDAGETVDVELGNEYFGAYTVEVVSDEDLNLDNNKIQGTLEPEFETVPLEGEVTGSTVTGEKLSSQRTGILGVLDSIIRFFRNLF